MISEKRHTVMIGRNKVSVPLYRDLETTETIAGEVAERLEQIETKSPVVDTQKFAVQAAYEFAMERRALEDEQREDTQDLVKALERLAKELRQLVERFRMDP